MSSTVLPDGSVEVNEDFPRPSHRSQTSILAADEPILGSLEDHFTLPTSSNLVRFRTKKNAARVYEAKGVQVVMEESFDRKKLKSTITVRRLTDETSGVQFLRLLYSIVCALFTGFLFVFCLQALLLLVLDLAVESGATEINAEVHVGIVIGVVLAIIVFVHAFAEALIIAGHFISDSWTGHFLAKQFIFKQFDDITIEWIYFLAFLLVPLLVMGSSLLAERDDWWSLTAIVWFASVMSFFVIFCFNIIYYEVTAAFNFAKNRNDTDRDQWMEVVKRCILLRQTHLYSGKTKSIFLARSYFTDTEDTEDTRKAHVFENTRVTTHSWWAKITTAMPNWAFRELDEPTRLYTIDDVQDYRPFLTRGTWSLEKIFCRPQNSRYIAIIHGPGALTKSQIRSSLACSFLGTAVIILLVVGFLVWFQIDGAFVAFAFCISLIFAWGALTNARNLIKVGTDLVVVKRDVRQELQTEGGEEGPKDEIGSAPPNAPVGESRRVWEKAGTEPSEAVFLVSEYNRVNEATDVFCWVMFRLELGVFFVYPLVTLFMINWNIAILFLFCASVSIIRHYINAAVVIEETGNMDLVGGETPEERWENKSRLNDIVDGITASPARRLWVTLVGGGGFGFLAIFLGAVGSSTENTNTETFTYLPNFHYPAQSNDMRYPTCTMSNLNGGFGSNSTLADFAFLSSIAYRPEELTQPALDSWFGFGGVEAFDEQDYVDAFREREDPDNTAVFFKMVSFPQQSLAMIVIRGTSNNWDMLADSQLWSAAALMQGLRAILPAGEIWTPILDQLVHWVNTLQSESLDKVSFYRLTKKFAEDLKENPDYDWVQVTGHSLGGGLAMITGAQAKIPGVGLSGPNALISGASFSPPVREEDMNAYTFNIVPRKDIVPMLDDLADQFQYIRCEAPAYDFVGCHYSLRSLCEILYTCGTGNRPAICECHTEFGYPKPETDGDEDFDELCAASANS